jgi:tetratricopeptide (TPR) repeat protein
VTRATLAAAVVGLGLSIAHAQPAPTPAPNPAADAALAEGRRLYDLKEWDKAIAKFKEAYTLRDDVPALFNIAQAYRLKGDCANALSFYKTFKKKFPKEKVIEKVDGFIVEMEACAKNPPPTTTTTTTTVPPPATTTTTTAPATTTTAPPPTTEPVEAKIDYPAPYKMRFTSYALMGVGAIGIGAGVFFAVRARNFQSEAEDVPANMTWDPEIENKGKSAQKWSRISFAVGGVAAVTGTVLFVLSRKPTHENQPVAITPETGGASLVWSGSF